MSLRDWGSAIKEGAGEVIDGGGEIVAKGLEKVGADDAGQSVRDAKNSVANRMHADVDEQQLDQTEDPKKLIYGSASKLRATATHLRDFHSAFTKVGGGLKKLDSSHLKGKTAEAFRDKVSVEPKKWFKAADACEKAADALDDFAGTVSWAQGQAREAVAAYKKANEDSETERTAHNKKVEDYNTAARDYRLKSIIGQEPGMCPAPPGDFKDPGPAGRAEAEGILSRAREQRDTAAAKVRTLVAAARDAAPPKPSTAAQLRSDADIAELNLSHVPGGVINGMSGTAAYARSMNPMDLYNLTHPADYTTNVNTNAAGIYAMAKDPKAAAQTMVDALKNDPGDFFGQFATPGAAKGPGLLRRTASAARRSGTPGRSRLGSLPQRLREAMDNWRKKTDNTDPVDLATGRMFLPQTDVTLPGALPLVFSRQVDSAYDQGYWFGPSWSSTVDQRLEVDSEGVVLVSDDGRLIAYPHPAPGLPTLPEVGARWPLERTRDGGYTLTDPDTGHVRHFSPPEDGVDGIALLEQISDRNGHRITFEYAPDGTPTDIVHSAGYHLRLTVEDDRVTALHLGDQELARYGYTDGNLTEVVNSSGLPLRFAYDDERRVTSWTDTNDRRYDYVYDNQDRCIGEGGTEGHLQVRIDYGAPDPATGHYVTTLTTRSGHQTRHLFNERCQQIAVTGPTGAVTRTEHDAHDQVLTHTDPLGRTTGFSYDTAGRLVSVTRPDGREASVTRNALGLPTSVTDADGTTWHYAYDERGNRTRVTDPLGHTTRYRHDSLGHLAAVTNALGETTRVRCDAAGLPVEITDPAGAVTTYTRDAFGRPTTLVDPVGGVTHLTWSVEGRLLSRTEPDGATESWTYDGEGNRTRHVDPVGGVTSYEYTHFDLLTARTGPDGVRYTFDHDTELRLTQVTNPQGLTWTYTYDPAGRLTTETDFDDRTHTYTHDTAGQLTTRTTPLGDVIEYQRDALGRITHKLAGGQTTTFGYDLAGRLTEAISPDAELLWQRDKLGRVKTEIADGRVLTHTYDALSRRTRRTTPTGAVSTSTYDPSGNRTALTTGGHTLDFRHDAAGRETSRTIGGALSLTQLWDPSGRLTDQTLTGPSAQQVQRRTYTYRADGHLTALTDQISGTRTFDLDAAGQVTAVHAANWTETYAYDDAGNQTHANWPTDHASPDATGPRTYTGTRIHTAGRIRYEHDDAGRVTLRQRTRLSRKPDTWRYTWNSEDRLTQCVTPDGTTWHYRYDPLGRRTTKQRLTDSGEVVERVDFTWDGPTLIEQTTTTPDFPDPVTLTWDHHGHTPLTQTERRLDALSQAEVDSRFFAIITDQIGTPTELVTESGSIAWHTRTTLWGTTTWNRDATTYTPLRFPGQYHDPETGLHYNFFRHYDPTTARYTTPDPLGLTPAPNPLTYVGNPHKWVDVLGLAPAYGDRRSFIDRLKDKLTGHDPQRATDEQMRADRTTMRLGDLDGIGTPDVGKDPLKEGLARSLSDEDLLDAINNPDGIGHVVTAGEGVIIQGNHRIAEALSRMNDPNHPKIGPDSSIDILAPDGLW